MTSDHQTNPGESLRTPAGSVILNSEKDITDQLLDDICGNRLTSLVINYDFSGVSDAIHHNLELPRLNPKNPFQMANARAPLESIEFEIILSPAVKSLAVGLAAVAT